MNVKRFTAPTARDAMRQVREALGQDAVILSNRPVDGGVEIIAMPAESVAALSAPVVEAEARQRQLEAAAVTAPVNAAPAPDGRIEPSMPEPRATEPVTAAVAAPARIEAAPAEPLLADEITEWQPPAPRADGDSTLVRELMGEIRAMREELESHIDDLTWRDLPSRKPAGAAMMRSLLAAGFSTALSRRMLDNLPAGLDPERAIQWAKDVLVQELQVLPSEAGLIDGGGVFAITGPTGAGKTTTTAKLAARFVVRHGADKLALLTTDGYRIGGHEQLRIYGKILGVPVHAVRDASDLKLALSELGNKHTVLIDTVGMSQRDRAVAEQVEMLMSADRPIKRLLVLNATSNGETLNEVIHAYKGRGLDGAILSKIDEAASLGPVLDCALRHRLAIHYLATGQRVPEDLHLANRQYLVQRAFKTRAAPSPWALEDDELAFALAGAKPSHAEVRVG